MKKKTKFSLLAIISISLITLVFSCTKDEVKQALGNANIDFRLTDAPCDYDNVFIDVQGIEIHSDSMGWESVSPFNAGIYDILELANGLDTLLCQVTVPEGKISQIRLILGDNNSVVVGGTTHNIKVPSGSQSGLKLNLHQYFYANTSYTVWLDFDACKSIIEKGNGEYSLKPVIRAFSDSTNGKLTGFVQPDSALAVVHAIKGTDTVTSIPGANGAFTICGLDGTYDILFETANNNVNDSTIQGVTINYGQVVSLGTVQLQ